MSATNETVAAMAEALKHHHALLLIAVNMFAINHNPSVAENGRNLLQQFKQKRSKLLQTATHNSRNAEEMAWQLIDSLPLNQVYQSELLSGDEK